MDKTISESRLLYGIDKLSKKLVFIDDAQNGKACNCVCPECGCDLEARNGGQVRMHTFAHYSENKAHHKSGHGNSNRICFGGAETILHKAAKQVFEELGNNPIELPAEIFITHRIPYHVNESRTVTIARVDTEESVDTIRPDIVLHTTDGETIFVEVCVTHPVDDEKKSKLKVIGIPCLEVNIDDLSIEHGIPWDDLRKRLLSNNSHRKWVYSPVLDRLYQKRRHFDRIVYVPQVSYSDPCVLLPEDRKDNVFRCYTCPFFAGVKFNYSSYYSYCSANQLINMQDIHMNENEVQNLVESVRLDLIKKHEKYLIEKQKNDEEKLIFDIQTTEDAISTIGVVTLDSVNLIKTARALYDGLPETARYRVSNVSKLDSAEKELEMLQAAEQKRKEEEKRIREVEIAIDSFSNNVYFSFFNYWEYPGLKERVEQTKEAFFNLSKTAQTCVRNRNILIRALDSYASEKQRIIEEQRRDAERNAKVEAFLSTDVHKRKRIYRDSEGKYMVEGDCPMSIALKNNDTSKAFFECAQCALCERNADLTGRNQFIICNGYDKSKLEDFLNNI